ncbi:hypothetical protein HJG60_009461 [Phyllostomus discolor]|uniref:Uncharacterized protein n=1 Tax=Phyllostomus discolor TaxID=89673 RepID=A0A833Y939_9CHIR|nr:hypothetical protein HJG60_009461 [Phyllostomus discolor]
MAVTELCVAVTPPCDDATFHWGVCNLRGDREPVSPNDAVPSGGTSGEEKRRGRGPPQHPQSPPGGAPAWGSQSRLPDATACLLLCAEAEALGLRSPGCPQAPQSAAHRGQGCLPSTWRAPPAGSAWPPEAQGQAPRAPSECSNEASRADSCDESAQNCFPLWLPAGRRDSASRPPPGQPLCPCSPALQPLPQPGLGSSPPPGRTTDNDHLLSACSVPGNMHASLCMSFLVDPQDNPMRQKPFPHGTDTEKGGCWEK